MNIEGQYNHNMHRYAGLQTKKKSAWTSLVTLVYSLCMFCA